MPGLRSALRSDAGSRRLISTVTSPSTGLDKYTQYKVRVAASTAAGESPESDEDNISVLTPEDGRYDYNSQIHTRKKRFSVLE